MPSFKLCMNSRMNLSACTHLQRVHHPQTCAPSKAIHFSWGPRWWRSMSTSWSGKLLWESWTLFGLNTKKAHTRGLYLIKRSTLFLSAAAIDMQAALHIVPHDVLLSEVRCCNNLMNMEISRQKKNLTLGGKVNRSLKMSARQQTWQTKNPGGRDAWTLTVQTVCVQLQLSHHYQDLWGRLQQCETQLTSQGTAPLCPAYFRWAAVTPDSLSAQNNIFGGKGGTCWGWNHLQLSEETGPLCALSPQ